MVCENEVWKDIEGFEGLYMVSASGKIKSMRKTPRVLKAGKHWFGYDKYTLVKGGKLHYVSLHRILAVAFIPNPLSLPCVNHIDCDPTNNSIENLEWCTWSYNTRHAFKTGRHDFRGSRNGQAKLTEEQAMYIFNYSEDKAFLEKMFNISRQAINDIKNGRRWSYITGKYHKCVSGRIIDLTA